MSTGISTFNSKTPVRILFGVLLAVLTAFSANAQNSRYSKAHRLYFQEKYEEAIPVYRKALSRGIHPLSMERLADCYREVGDSKRAEVWYKKAKKAGRNNSATQLHYARMLHANGKYEEAATEYEIYMNETRDYRTVANDFRSCKLALYLQKKPSGFSVSPLGQINTTQDDLVGAILGDDIFISTGGKHGNLDKPRKETSARKSQDLVRVERKKAKRFEQVKDVRGGINTREDESSPSFSPDGKKVLFSRSVTLKASKGGKSYTARRIFVADVADGKWVNAREANFNGPATVDNFDPAWMPDGKAVVFASTRKSGVGGADLYWVAVNGDKFGKPENLSGEINTTGDEVAPSFSADGSLYFASNGHPGLGGLDLFSAEYTKLEWRNPQNLGAGINTSKNERGIVFDGGMNSGYFASARNFENGYDIFFFEKLPTIDGIIRDSLSFEVVPGVELILSDGSEEQVTETDAEGSFTFYGELGKFYSLRIKAPGYKSTAYKIGVDSSLIQPGAYTQFQIAPRMVQTFEGMVMDSELEIGLKGARIELVPRGRGRKKVFPVDNRGRYKFQVTDPGEYDLVFKRNGYRDQKLPLDLSAGEGREVRNFDISLDWDGETPVASAFVGNGGSIATPVRMGGTGEFPDPAARLAGSPATQSIQLAGKIFESGRGEYAGLDGTKVNVVNLATHQTVDSATTNADGSFSFVVPVKKNDAYCIIASKPGYFSSSQLIAPDEKVEVKMGMEEATYGLDSTLFSIHYNYNNSGLDLETQGKLVELGYFMQNNPDAILEVWSFTDSRGSRTYNRKLSQRRSESVINYIRNQIELSQKRFNPRGFGEDQLLNDCVDGQPCSEAEHQENRRTEIKVVN